MSTTSGDGMSAEGKIVTLLERNMESGRKAWDVYEDWLDMSLATLTMLPAHAEAVVKTGKPAQDTPEIVALWERLNATYRRSDWDNFREAYHLLTETAARRSVDHDATKGSNWDIFGSVYMQLNVSSNHSGQYFTPWDAACMMAAVLTENMGAEIQQRMLDAVERVTDQAERALLDSAALLSGALDDSGDMFAGYILPILAPHVEPVTVCDPCCGSGVMLLAAASRAPVWARHWGIVQFYGQDIDPTCVKMAKSSMMLYGLNGYGLRLQVASAGAKPATPTSRPAPAPTPIPPTPIPPTPATITQATEPVQRGQLTLF